MIIEPDTRGGIGKRSTSSFTGIATNAVWPFNGHHGVVAVLIAGPDRDEVDKRDERVLGDNPVLPAS
jgi:hypothetical protein